MLVGIEWLNRNKKRMKVKTVFTKLSASSESFFHGWLESSLSSVSTASLLRRCGGDCKTCQSSWLLANKRAPIRCLWPVETTKALFGTEGDIATQCFVLNTAEAFHFVDPNLMKAFCHCFMKNLSALPQPLHNRLAKNICSRAQVKCQMID